MFIDGWGSSEIYQVEFNIPLNTNKSFRGRFNSQENFENSYQNYTVPMGPKCEYQYISGPSQSLKTWWDWSPVGGYIIIIECQPSNTALTCDH